jgi:hypothetical protein
MMNHRTRSTRSARRQKRMWQGGEGNSYLKYTSNYLRKSNVGATAVRDARQLCALGVHCSAGRHVNRGTVFNDV